MSTRLFKLVLEYWHGWGLDTAQIAKRTGVPEHRVYNALARAREQERAG